MTEEQAGALGIDQFLAFRPEQLAAMTLSVLETMMAMLDSVMPPHGNWSDSYPDHYNDTYDWWNVTDMPHHQETTQTHPVESQSTTDTTGIRYVTYIENPGVVDESTGATVDLMLVTSVDNQNTDAVGRTTSFPNVTTTTRQTVNSGVRVTPRPGDGRASCCADDDPFEYQSQILDTLDAVPDSVTTQNVDQFLPVLSFIPAADIASKFTPAAVSLHVIIIFTVSSL